MASVTIEEALRQAAASEEAGRPDIAENIYRAILSKFPQSTEARNGLRDILASQGKNTDDANVPRQQDIQIAIAHYDSGDLQKAEAQARSLLAQFPNALILHSVLGAALLDQDRNQEAVECFRDVVALEPNAAEGHNNLGIALQKSGAADDATASFREAVRLKPDFADAHINLGGALSAQGQIDEAIECYRAVDPNTESAEISALLLECYFRNANKTAFDIQLQLIKSKQEAFNFRAAAAAAYAAHQFEAENAYAFCEDPIALVTTFNLFEDGAIDESIVAELESDISDGGMNEHLGSGPRTVGDVFTKQYPQFDGLEGIIRQYIHKYFERHAESQSRFIADWPQQFDLDGRYTRLTEGGETAAHFHAAWLSGVLCLKAPENGPGDGNNIEFTLRGYELPVLRDDYPRKMVEMQPGTLVLFPSSLPHRVVPFTSDEERVFIPFDVIPK